MVYFRILDTDQSRPDFKRSKPYAGDTAHMGLKNELDYNTTPTTSIWTRTDMDSNWANATFRIPEAHPLQKQKVRIPTTREMHIPCPRIDGRNLKKHK